MFFSPAGLKIQSLRLEEREAAMKEEANADDEDAAKNGGGAHDGPWKKIEQPVLPESHTEVVSEVKEVQGGIKGGIEGVHCTILLYYFTHLLVLI